MGIKTYRPYTPSRRQMTGSIDIRIEDNSGKVSAGFQKQTGRT